MKSSISATSISKFWLIASVTSSAISAWSCAGRFLWRQVQINGVQAWVLHWNSLGMYYQPIAFHAILNSIVAFSCRIQTLHLAKRVSRFRSCNKTIIIWLCLCWILYGKNEHSLYPYSLRFLIPLWWSLFQSIWCFSQVTKRQPQFATFRNSGIPALAWFGIPPHCNSLIISPFHGGKQ